MSFSDEVIVLKDKTILEKGSPTKLYNHPKHKYTAALFEDVNEILKKPVFSINQTIFRYNFYEVEVIYI